MDWRVKGMVQKALSLAPGGVWVNDFLQRTVGTRSDLGDQVSNKVNDDWVVQLEHMNELGVDLRGLVCLEIGSGWHPVLPVCYALAGVARVHTYDLTRHLDERYSLRMIAELRKHLPAIAKASRRPLAEVEAEHARLCAATSLDELLRHARIEYHAPADASSTGLPGASVDMVFSNNVLEHIPGDVLLAIMRESVRVLRPDGLAVHGVNCGDHYAYADRNITPINYLGLSEREWSFWNNDLQYQNRLRSRDFLEIAAQAGLETILVKQSPRPELLAMLPRMKIAPEFHKYPPVELACTSIDFVARKPALRAGA